MVSPIHIDWILPLSIELILVFLIAISKHKLIEESIRILI